MKEFNIPFEYWLKMPLFGNGERIGFQDLVEALRWKYHLESKELDKAKKPKGGIDLEFE